ncbi:MAG: CinA family protein [Ferruginibacter sp.]|uniref:CinA family protein n=1 Tax=Ferruginibacter sp. TaxID=1940288 RepID=UPI0026583931|nr:CinA family protein [Ferruginibacter sp.]MDB5278593.1 CinA family protein [Ferruginibacter sp.]
MVASQLALGAAKTFSSDWGIGVTGYASPLPGHDMNPLHALFAISYKNNIVKADKITAVGEESLNVQLIYVNSILKGLLITLHTIH